MGNFRFHKKSGSGKSYGHHDRGHSGFGRQHGDREMFEAVCSACGKTTSLPFKPNGRKPVYCNDCFKKQGGGSDEGRRSSFRKRPDYGRRPDFERRPDSRPQDNEQYQILNRKIDKMTDMLRMLLEEKHGEGKKSKPKKEKKLKNATPISMPEPTLLA